MDIAWRVPLKAGDFPSQLTWNLPASSQPRYPGSGHSDQNRYEKKQGQTTGFQAPSQSSGIANPEGVEGWLEIRSKCLLRRPISVLKKISK